MIDLKFPAFSFSNHWHYFFRGEIIHKTGGRIIDKNSVEFRTNKPNVTILDVLALEGDKKYIYKGLLLDYNLKEENEDLDSIVLYQPMKKIYDKDYDEQGHRTIRQFEEIPGNFILLPYSNIININVQIKPFETPQRNVSVLPPTVEQRVEPTDAKLTPSGCFFMVALIVTFILSTKFAVDVSYFRFSVGMFILFTFLSGCHLLVESLTKVFTWAKLIYLILLLIFSFYFFVWIFNVSIFNPLKLVLSYIL